MTAQLGSIYDIPTSMSSDVASTKASSNQTGATLAGSYVRFSDTANDFRQTEGATYKPPFKSFFTNNE